MPMRILCVVSSMASELSRSAPLHFPIAVTDQPRRIGAAGNCWFLGKAEIGDLSRPAL
ncbi:hypothetical protein [Mesorhizobium intechi]|uniref:hypothetical protein n=1 Tax=Mesorhizobium intechi TaxID=537601 RepID=UPI00142ED12D|nr:hypothetical protein [Mesorhizobium intechi]